MPSSGECEAGAELHGGMGIPEHSKRHAEPMQLLLEGPVH